ncbi:TPA: DUF2806 domain-containing protein [Klebsiella pneumoniae subsp. pneumoniae]|nr:DUF2806 domain-containing protein [Klebsiella pneumoniae subsp. pneumoniae]
MTDGGVIAIVQKLAKPLFSIVKVTGPFLLSQSKAGVENYSNYQLNKSRLEAISLFLAEEAKNISADRAKLRDKIINSNGLERIRAQNDYDLLTKELNKFSTISKIKNFIGDDDVFDNEKEISDGWIDKFNQLASSLNEEWRSQLLAKAFSEELKKPGSITMIVLNSIASFDEASFRKFGQIINASIRLYEVNCFPSGHADTVFNIDGKEIKLSQMIYEISHLNLISPTDSGYINCANSLTHLRYGKRILTIQYPHNPIPYPSQILCYFFTTLGNQIASFYERDLIPQGYKNFESLIESAKRKGYHYSETELTEADYSTLGN